MIINQKDPVHTSRHLIALLANQHFLHSTACKTWLGHFMYLCSLMGLFCSKDQALHCFWPCTGLAAFAQLTSMKTGLVTSSGAAGFTNSICRLEIDKLIKHIRSSKKIIFRPSCPEELDLFYLASFTLPGIFISVQALQRKVHRTLEL